MVKTSDYEAKLKELERRIQLLEDKEGIRECLARYCFNADVGRVEEYADTFAPDGYLEMEGRRLEGREGLMDMFAGSGLHTSIMNRSTHNVTNVFIRVNGATAWAEFYQIVFVKEKEGDVRKLHFMSYTHCTFVKRNGRWYIKERIRREVGGQEWGGKIVAGYLEERSLCT